MRVGKLCREFLDELRLAVSRERERLTVNRRSGCGIDCAPATGSSTESFDALSASLDEIETRIVLLQQDAPSLDRPADSRSAFDEKEGEPEFEDEEVHPLLLACARYDLSAHRTFSASLPQADDR